MQAIQAPPQIFQIKGPPRVCGVCSCTLHYTDEYPQIQGDCTLAVTNPYNDHFSYHPLNQGSYSHWNNYIQGWRDNSHQRWNQWPSNPPSQHQQSYQSSSQPPFNNHSYQSNQTHHNQPFQHQHKNQSHNQRYRPPHQRQQSPTNQPSSSSPNQPSIEDSLHPFLQEQERLQSMVEKQDKNHRILRE
ncbi:hypothetical protein AHAS_Ahas15G0157100 [Arachis hypogaea]